MNLHGKDRNSMVWMIFAVFAMLAVLAIPSVSIDETDGTSDDTCHYPEYVSSKGDDDPIYGLSTPIAITFTFDPNGGSGSVQQYKTTMTRSTNGDRVTVDYSDIDLPTRNGYTLAGFSTTKDDPTFIIPVTSDKVSVYNSGTKYVYNSGGHVYAYWVPNSIYVELSPDSPTDVQVDPGDFVMFSGTDLTGDYGIESDWMNSMVETDQWHFMHAWGYIGEGSVTQIRLADKTISIYTEIPSVTITFMSDSGVYATLVVPWGSTGIVFTPNDVEGIFTGWFYDSAYQREYDPTAPINDDIILYAKGLPPLIFTTDPIADGEIIALEGQPGTISFRATDSKDYTSALWDFGDGSTSSNLYSTHYYAQPGTYTATLTVFNNYGSDTMEFLIEVPQMAPGGGGNDRRLWVAVGHMLNVAGGLVVRRLL